MTRLFPFHSGGNVQVYRYLDRQSAVDSWETVPVFHYQDRRSAVDRMVSYGSSSRIVHVGESTDGMGLYVCADDGTVEFILLDESSENPYNSNPFCLAVGENYGCAMRLSFSYQDYMMHFLQVGCASSDEAIFSKTYDLKQKALVHKECLGVDAPYLFKPSALDRGVDDCAAECGKGNLSEITVVTPLEMERLLNDKGYLEELTRIKIPSAAVSYAVSLDGRTIALQLEHDIKFNDGHVAIDVPSEAILCGVSNGGVFYSARQGNSIWILKADGLVEPIRYQVDQTAVEMRGGGVAFTPSGDRCAFWIDASTIGVIDTSNGRLLLTLDNSSSYPGGDVQFTSDGRIIYSKRSEHYTGIKRMTTMMVWSDRTFQQLAYSDCE